jgi:hypothetical protein
MDRNYGKSSHIRIKGTEMLMLAKFDTAPIKGWTIEKASLFLHAAGAHKLKTMGVSTIAVDWVEGDGRGSQANGGATFTWADGAKGAPRRWGGAQSDFTDAALTAQRTWVHYADLKEHEGAWLEIEIPPRFVHALINGDSYGLAITDEKGQTRWNNDVHSREQSGFEPYMLVVGKHTGRTPSTAHAAEPPLRPGSGQASAVPTRPRLAPLPIVNVSGRPGGEPPLRDGQVRVWAYGECEKAHPVSGNLLEEVGEENYAKAPSGDYRKRNAVWDGGACAIRLSGARNEFVAFHLCVEAAAGRLNDVRIQSADLTGADGAKISSQRISIFKDWYVKDGEWFPEVALPLDGPFSIPDARNGIAGQRNQSLLVEIYIPHDLPSGDYAGNLRISAEGAAPIEVPITLTVWGFKLPDTLSFDVDLNAYGPPGDAEMELKFHRMAHAHRATLNILGYNQAGAHPDYVPPLEGSGRSIRVKDWTDFDRRHGRYFDGAAFDDLPRKGVPLAHAYLPFHEGWPSDIRRHYRYRQSVSTYPELIIEHALKAPPVEDAFDQEFKDEFAAIVQQFAEHFRSKGWTRTQFQFYLNNKYFWKDPKKGGRGSSWWLLDEPMQRDDWLALRFFGQMFKQALAQTPNSNFIFRCDISRPQWQRDWLDGLVDLMCVSGQFYRKNERCMAMRRSQGITFWNYGTANDIRATNLTGEAWALKVYLSGGDGLLPWNSLGKDSSFDKPTPTTILYPGLRFGIAGPLASLRLKALRRGQQDVEYLALLAKKMNWDREQIAEVLAPVLQLHARTHEAFADDAGRTLFDNLTAEQFARFRASVAAALMGYRAGVE